MCTSISGQLAHETEVDPALKKSERLTMKQKLF